MSSNKNIFNGLKWASIELAFDSIFKFAIKLILAKLLLPEDFGLLGMCAIFIGITQSISQLGMNAALIQRKDNASSEILFNTAFWTNLIFSLVIFVLIAFIFSPLISGFYNQPILNKIIPALSLSILVQPFSLIHITILTRSLDFKSLSKAYNLSTLVSGITAIILAYMGFGVWSLVVDYLLATSLVFFFIRFYIRWTPKIEWKKVYFKRIFGFGIFATGTSLIRVVSGNIDYLIIGKLLGSTLLGSYTLSFMLSKQLKDFLSRAINKVMYPVFSQLQDNSARLKQLFLSILKINSLILYPIMMYLIYFANDIILVFFGEKWIESILPLQILCLATMVDLLGNASDTLLRAKGKPDLELKIMTAVNLVVLVPGLILGVTFLGLVGAAIAVFVNTVFFVGLSLIAINKEVGLNHRDIFLSIKSSTIGVSLSTMLCLILNYYFDRLDFIISSAIFALVYLICLYKLEIKYIKNMFKNLF